jgi:hypothetical protein
MVKQMDNFVGEVYADLQFKEYNIAKWENLGPHIPGASAISICGEWYDALHCCWQTKRPNSRSKEDGGKVVLEINGLFEENVFCSVLSIPRDLIKSSLALEIKVKGAFPSISPFIFDPATFIKHEMSRFNIMQLHKEFKRRVKQDNSAPWGSFECISQYCPSDFLSGQILQMENAIKFLFLNPQNNLKVYQDMQHVFGWTINSPLALQQFLMSVFVNSGSESALHRLISIMSDEMSLSYCSVFGSLLQLQCLDVLDSEGAEYVYCHLSSLYTDESTCCQDLRNFLVSPITEDLVILSKVLHLLHLGDGEGEVLELLNANGKFSRGVLSLLVLVNSSIPSLKSAPLEQKQANCLEARRIVTELFSRSDCLLLLKAWMMSTIACDASIVLQLYLDNDRKMIGSHLFLIDIGMKSFSKFTKKAAKDAKICRDVTTFLSEMG